MLNKKKILLLTMILVVALTICISPGFAVTKTTGKLYFDTKKEGNPVAKKVGSQHQDRIELYYNVKWFDTPPKIQTFIILGEANGEETKYQLKSAKVTYIKKIGSKNYYSTKIFKPKGKKQGFVEYKAKNGYKPYYAIITYTDIGKTQKMYFNTKKDGASVSKKIFGFYPSPRKIQLQYNVGSDLNSKKIQTYIIAKQPSYTSTRIKLVNAKVTFIKKVGSKNKYMMKTFKPKNGKISYNDNSGYKPYYAEITYKWFYKRSKS